jgi:nucleoside-diphosphate-sugar epimerase
MSYGRLSHGIRRNRLHRPPSSGAASPKWRDGALGRTPSPRVQMTTELPQAAELIQADVLDDVAVGGAVAGTDAVVNLVGILTETTSQTYRAIHVEGARRVALAAQRHGVTRLIHNRPSAPARHLRRSRTGQRLRENRPSERYSRRQRSSGRASCLARMITSSPGSPP